MALSCPEISARHAAPGQYVRVKLDDGGNPYALASAPGAPELELLYKADTPLTTAMSGLAPGDALPMTAPEGAGFPVAEHRGRDLILVAAGTGIAPLRAVVHVVLRD